MGWELIDVDVGISVANLLGLLLLMRPVDCVFCLGTWYTATAVVAAVTVGLQHCSVGSVCRCS